MRQVGKAKSESLATRSSSKTTSAKPKRAMVAAGLVIVVGEVLSEGCMHGSPLGSPVVPFFSLPFLGSRFPYKQPAQ